VTLRVAPREQFAVAVEEMVETRTFDGDGMAVLFDGSVNDEQGAVAGGHESQNW